MLLPESTTTICVNVCCGLFARNKWANHAVQYALRRQHLAIRKMFINLQKPHKCCSKCTFCTSRRTVCDVGIGDATHIIQLTIIKVNDYTGPSVGQSDSRRTVSSSLHCRTANNVQRSCARQRRRCDASWTITGIYDNGQLHTLYLCTVRQYRN